MQISMMNVALVTWSETATTGGEGGALFSGCPVGAHSEIGRDERVVVRIDRRSATGRRPQVSGAAKVAQEQPLELVSEDAVNDEVDGRVDRHQQVTDARHLVHQNVGRFEDVHHLPGTSTQS